MTIFTGQTAFFRLPENSFTYFDVVVIGSGPAGVAAAITCSKAGLKTVIVTDNFHAEIISDSETSVRPSESVHPGIISLLELLGAADAIKVSSRSVYETITTAGHPVSLGADESGAWTGHHIDRILFDRHLVQAAKKQGVEFLEKEKVIEICAANKRITGIRTSSGRIISSKYVIDGSGQKRIAGKKLKFKEKFYSPALIVSTGFSENTGTVFPDEIKTQFIPSVKGWSWIAPEPNGYTWTQLSLKGEKQITQPSELNEYGRTQTIYTSNRRWRAFRPLVKEGIVLCGDAAGILDPAAGQGILNGLHSGITAAQCVVKCVANSSMESFYLAQYDSWFIGQFEKKALQLREYYGQFGINLFN